MTKKRMETAVDLAASLTRLLRHRPDPAGEGVDAVARRRPGVDEEPDGQASEVKPEKGDKRFRDPVWASNPAYKALMESYLAWSGALTSWVDSLDVPARDKLRAKLVTEPRHRRAGAHQRGPDQPGGHEGDARPGRPEPGRGPPEPRAAT